MSKAVLAPKGRKSGRFQSYDDLLNHTNKPLAQRRELAIGRNGSKVVPRKFHLDDDEVSGLKAKLKELGKDASLSDKLIAINPHNKGFYHYLFAALAEKPNEDVPQSRIMARVEKLMSSDDTIQGEGKEKTTAWERWANKDPRNPETGKDMEGRFDQNVTVLQRLTGMTPYGRRIYDLHKVIGGKGVVIDVLVNESTGTKYLRLNTDSKLPLNQSKVRGMGSAADPAVQRAEKRAAKAEAAASTPAPKRTRKPKATAPAATEGDTAPAATAEAVTA